MQVRRARYDEGQQLVSLWGAAVDATHHFLSAEDRRAIGEHVAQFLPQAPLWVAASDEDTPVAFMLLDNQHMEALFVDPRWHGKGIGSLLIDHALTLCPALTTDVNEQNRAALAFYLSRGFEIAGRSATDSEGRAYPLLHLRYQGSEE
ncbi:acetyltransferase [Shimwellia pseudoproteus]|uniref:acetyltransferase n=1 Tax=Shimwellia pseudoproteus TaxID=570012 RepID=UPI0018EC4AF4|nr:acetyltransferase [Shimwellia pseudoproteus]MBJ3816261.1 acetyltransferase [Shimwellia pseudoproteus]